MRTFQNTALATLLMFTGFILPAQADGPTPEKPPASNPTPTPPVLSALKERQKTDAAVDKNMLLPTAEIIGKGDVTFNSYQIILAGFTYGMTDTSQITFTTMLPIIGGIPAVLLANVKWKVLQTDRVIVSVQPQAGFAYKDDVAIGVLGAGLITDIRLDDEARAILTGSFFSNTIFSNTGIDDEIGFAALTFSASFSYRVNHAIKLMTELTLPGAYAWANGKDAFELLEEGLLLGYGIRFYGKTHAFDLTFQRPIHPDVANDFTEYLPMGYPYIAYSVRF